MSSSALADAGTNALAQEAVAEVGQEPASGFTVSLQGFDGPFDLLLSLIAKRRMDVTTVALAEVTDEFLSFVRTLDDRRALEESSQFVFVAATLLDLKIAQLLPGAQMEDEEDVSALEARDLLFARLLQYRAFKEIAEQMGRAVDASAGRFGRRPGTHPNLAGLLPELVFNATADDLKALAERALSRQSLEPDHVRLEHLHAPEVSLSVEKAAMCEQLRVAGTCSFGELVAEPVTGERAARIVVVVRFLALLEMFRDQQVEVEQQEPLGLLQVIWAADSEHTELDQEGAQAETGGHWPEVGP